MTTWVGDPPPLAAPPGAAGWLLVVLRGGALGIVTFGCLGLLLVVRLVERPLCGLHRPVTPRITRFVCRSAFRILGIRHVIHGHPMQLHGAIVANHSSWLDIFALNACDLIYFVSKSEVAGWPGIGWLARATGTVFINRNGREAAEQKRMFEDRLDAGHRLLFFPEGTSTDGLRLLHFKSTLFAAFFTQPIRDTCAIQPVTVAYTTPEGEDARFYGWWGDMDFGSHLLKVLAARQQGQVDVIFHAPIPLDEVANRKALAAEAEVAVRAGLRAVLGARMVD